MHIPRLQIAARWRAHGSFHDIFNIILGHRLIEKSAA
jgi:hypothetical protein